MSKGGGKGGGGTHTPKINIPQGLKDEITNLGGLGNYEAQFLNFPGSLGNYYEALATGGTGPQESESWTGSFTGQGNGNLTGSPIQTYGAGGSRIPNHYGSNFLPGQGWQVTQGGSGGGSGGGGETGNPWVKAMESALQGEESIPGQIQGIQGQTAELNQQLGQSVTDLTKDFKSVESGKLLPGQQALIDQQVQSGQANIRSRLGAMGLTGSTQGAELESEIGLAGAATGGELEQGNIQIFGNLMQTAQKLALGGQTLALGETEALGNAFSQINTMAAGDQAQLFSQAMQGYGMQGAFLNNVLAPYGMQMKGYEDILHAEETSAQLEAGLEEAQLRSQDSQAGMLGGLFQGLGSLFGSGAAGGAAAGGTAAAESGITSLLGAAFAAI